MNIMIIMIIITILNLIIIIIINIIIIISAGLYFLYSRLLNPAINLFHILTFARWDL